MFILDINECIFQEELDQEKTCTNTHRMSNMRIDRLKFSYHDMFEVDRSSMNFNTVSVQTNSKHITETKSINMSLVKMFVHLLFKIVLNSNDTNQSKISLNDLLDRARRKKGSERIGDGTIYLSDLLVKLERLCDECKVQIHETIQQLEFHPSTDNMDK